MFVQQGDSIIAYCHYVNSGSSATGLTVTVNVYEHSSGTPIVSGGSCTELASGLYYYTLSGASVDANVPYLFVFTTAGTVDQADLASVFFAGTSHAATVGALESGVVTAAAVATDAIDADALAADAVTEIAAGLNNVSAADVWGYATRTLTQSAASVTAAVSGSDLSLIRGDEWSFSLTGLGDISSNRTNLYFTIKNRYDDDDDDALVQIDESNGLLYINQAAGTAGNGSVTVDDAAAGDITITLEAVESAKLPVRGNLVYDVQVIRSTGIDVQTLTKGTAAIVYDVTKATS